MSAAWHLPEDDQDFLRLKGIEHELLSEIVGAEVRRGVAFPDFEVPDSLRRRDGDRLVAGGSVTLLVLIPTGYKKARLDSWYLRPGLFLPSGAGADRANSEARLFEDVWQFWSRHLTDQDWRPDVDGLETYLQYVRAGLRCP